MFLESSLLDKYWKNFASCHTKDLYFPLTFLRAFLLGLFRVLWFGETPFLKQVDISNNYQNLYLLPEKATLQTELKTSIFRFGFFKD